MQYPHPCDLNTASAVLFDVVVLAGGEAKRMSPLCDAKPKPLLPLCNRPLIWYTIKPLVTAGCKKIYICAHDDTMPILQHYLSTAQDFENVVFHFVRVPMYLEDDTPTDTADALRCFQEFRKGENPTTIGEKQAKGLLRDVMVLSCDIILANVDLQPFVSNFYQSFASASTLLMRAPKKEERKEAHYSADDACFVALENESKGDSSTDPVAPDITHERLHLHSVDTSEISLDLTCGFLARRPNLTMSKSMLDVHVYLLRSWVVDYVVAHKELRNIREEVIAELAFSQHWSVSDHGTEDPSTKLNYKIPSHWLLAVNSTRSVAALNSMQASQPASWDENRCFATIYSHHPLHRIVRVNSKERYKTISEEIVVGLLQPVSLVTSPLSAMVIRQLKQETEDTVRGAGPLKAKGTALLSVPPADAKIGRSVVGRNVKIGKGCNIRQCVLMDNVEIGDGCTLKDTVVCAGVQIAAKEEVGPRPGATVEVIAASALAVDESESNISQGGDADEDVDQLGAWE